MIFFFFAVQKSVVSTFLLSARIICMEISFLQKNIYPYQMGQYPSIKRQPKVFPLCNQLIPKASTIQCLAPH